MEISGRFSPPGAEYSCAIDQDLWSDLRLAMWLDLGEVNSVDAIQVLPFLNFSCHFLAFVGTISVISFSVTCGGPDSRSSGFRPILD